jgi:hypothetical protein
MICPYCSCDDACGRERVTLPRPGRAAAVLSAVMDLYSKNPTVIDAHALRISRALVLEGYFSKYQPPALVDIENAIALIREVER